MFTDVFDRRDHLLTICASSHQVIEQNANKTARAIEPDIHQNGSLFPFSRSFSLLSLFQLKMNNANTTRKIHQVRSCPKLCQDSQKSAQMQHVFLIFKQLGMYLYNTSFLKSKVSKIEAIPVELGTQSAKGEFKGHYCPRFKNEQKALHRRGHLPYVPSCHMFLT